MSVPGSISCSNVTTTVINPSGSKIKIGPLTWPSSSSTPGDLVTDGVGNVAISPVFPRVVIDPTETTYSISPVEEIVAIVGTNATTLTLPDPSTKDVGYILYIVKETDSTNVITIVPFGTELIIGETSVEISNGYSSIALYTDGTNWFRPNFFKNDLPVVDTSSTAIPKTYTNDGLKDFKELMESTFTSDSVIVGSVAVGETLSVDYGVYFGRSRGNPSSAHQWRRDGVDIAGETGPTYDVTILDENTTISVVVDGQEVQ